MAENVGGIFYEVTADTSALVGQSRVVDRETQSMAASFNKITQAIKLYAAAMALVKSAQMADDMRLLAARVQVAAGSIEAGAAAMGELQRISARTQTELAATAGVFNRLNSSILAMGGNQNDTLRITELLGKAIKVSGASGVEASSAMTQFGQALGSGKLAGDELRSLLENAPYLMQQLAAGIGVPVGALKQLGEEGKLTADVVTTALGKAAGKIDEDFKKLPQTFSGAMTQVADAAQRANEKLDDMTGSSAALTGVAKGLAEVLDQLATQFGNATTEADKLGRSDSVKTWSAATTLALSFVVDAADFVKRGFLQIGVVIYETNQAALAAATGGFKEAGERLAGLKQQLMDIGSAQYAGAKIRQAAEALASGTDGSDPMDQRARGGAGSKLKPGAGSGTGKGGSKFDSAGYLAGLAKQTAEGLDKVNIVEEEALRKNAAMLAEGKISRETAAKAVTLIEANAVFERREILLAEAEERRALIEKQGQDEAAQARRLAAEQARGQQFATGILGQGDEVLRLQLELEAKSALLVQYAEQDQANMQLYAEAKVALEQQTAERIAEIANKRNADALAAQSQVLTGYGAMFGSLADITKGFAGEQSGAYKAMFAVSKAFAIADSIIKIQQGIASALSLPYPANIAAAASTAAAASGLISTIAGTNFGGGRQYGGPASAGTMYRVNEGGRPEMFTAANGAQYMMPTADGRVTPAGGGGGGSPQWTVIINNAPPGTSASVNNEARTVQVNVAEVAAQITERRGPVWSALQTTNVQGRL
jgi:tape measure domain-containing protein